MSGWALPAEIEAEIAASRVQTDCEPSLALNHALALDRRLAAMGWTQPVTLGATGVTCGGAYLLQDAMYRASDPEAVGLSSLHRAARLATTGDESGAVKLAYREAVKAEVAALNLLYANAALRVEHLWLHFANKYLAHVAAAAGKASAGSRLVVDPQPTHPRGWPGRGASPYGLSPGMERLARSPRHLATPPLSTTPAPVRSARGPATACLGG